jgi:hypothetical protein
MKQATNGNASASEPSEPYEPPAIEWQEVMEEAGVYAACAKDPFDPLSEGCFAFPKTGAS